MRRERKNARIEHDKADSDARRQDSASGRRSCAARLGTQAVLISFIEDVMED